MRALLGKQNWRESPALQAARERSKHIVLPPNPPRPEDDLEGYIAYIAGAERLAYLKGRSKNVWHQGCAAAMEI
ncbi:g7659 [Coccomyxa elongata]